MSGYGNRGNSRFPNYVEVKDRIKEFWARYPEGNIVTEVLHHDLERVMVRASVFRVSGETRPAGVGHAEEQRSSDPKRVNSANALENCETSAIGRALANMSITMSVERPSYEEMGKDERVRGSTPLALRGPGRTMPEDDGSLDSEDYKKLVATAQENERDGISLGEIKQLFVDARSWLTPFQLEHSRGIYRDIETHRAAKSTESATPEPAPAEGDAGAKVEETPKKLPKRESKKDAA
jgi:hypothetical protein